MFDLIALKRAVERHGRVARVVVASAAGSAPREVGAAMLVWNGGQSGTIGGGALELMAAERALSHEGLSRHPLGPELGQCCGGAVVLLTEVYDAARLAELDGQDIIARGPGDMPLSVARILDRARAQGTRPPAQLVGDWMVEPILKPSRDLWIWGAGHVGRALANVLSPLPDIALTWVDTAPDRFPTEVPDGVRILPAPRPEAAVPLAARDASHLVLTYSHAIDLALCHALLTHGFGFAGLIGSDTKWARFRSRLTALGHKPVEISRISCPIGQKSLGKHPQAIALGVATQIMALEISHQKEKTPWPTRFSASAG